jgi:hypothetical protein
MNDELLMTDDFAQRAQELIEAGHFEVPGFDQFLGSLCEIVSH